MGEFSFSTKKIFTPQYHDDQYNLTNMKQDCDGLVRM